jgi:hypothetical protein
MSPTSNAPPNKALHRTAIPLRSIAAGELGRSADKHGGLNREAFWQIARSK